MEEEIAMEAEVEDIEIEIGKTETISMQAVAEEAMEALVEAEETEMIISRYGFFNRRIETNKKTLILVKLNRDSETMSGELKNSLAQKNQR